MTPMVMPGAMPYARNTRSKSMMSKTDTHTKLIKRISAMQQARLTSRSSQNLFETEEILSKIMQKPGLKFSLFVTGILYVSAVSITVKNIKH